MPQTAPVRLVVGHAGAGEVAARHALDVDHLQLAHQQRPAPDLGRNARVVGGDQVVRGEPLEPEHAHRGEHAALVRDLGASGRGRRRRSGRRRRTAAARRRRRRVANLAAGDVLVVSERWHAGQPTCPAARAWVPPAGDPVATRLTQQVRQIAAFAPTDQGERPLRCTPCSPERRCGSRRWLARDCSSCWSSQAGAATPPMRRPAVRVPQHEHDPSVTIVPTPEVADIKVKTSTSTTTTTTTTTTTSRRRRPCRRRRRLSRRRPPRPRSGGCSSNEGARCDPEGAIGVGTRGDPLICRKDPQPRRPAALAQGLTLQERHSSTSTLSPTATVPVRTTPAFMPKITPPSGSRR